MAQRTEATIPQDLRADKPAEATDPPRYLRDAIMARTQLLRLSRADEDRRFRLRNVLRRWFGVLRQLTTKIAIASIGDRAAQLQGE